MRNGKGKITYTDTSYYDGDWVDNQKSGTGTHTYFDKNGRYIGKYEGEFKNGMRNGYGVFYYGNGVIQKGEWLDDKLLNEVRD